MFGIQHAFHADLVTDLYTAARETGYELALSAVTPDRDENEAITGLLQDRCEVLILLGPSEVEGVYLSTGYSGHGIMSSAGASRLVVESVLGQLRPEDNPFRLDRPMVERRFDIL